MWKLCFVSILAVFLLPEATLSQSSCFTVCLTTPLVAPGCTTTTSPPPTTITTITTTASTTTTTTTDLPDQCKSGNYRTLSEATRSTTYSGSQLFCDRTTSNPTSPHWKGSGWYKFANPAGTKIATSAPPPKKCGTYLKGWMTQPHPTEVGQTKTVQFCFKWNDNSCHWKTTGEVTKCGENNFVYKLAETLGCAARYCADP